MKLLNTFFCSILSLSVVALASTEELSSNAATGNLRGAYQQESSQHRELQIGCKNNKDCNDGYQCSGDRDICVAVCASHEECGEGSYCSTGGLCLPNGDCDEIADCNIEVGWNLAHLGNDNPNCVNTCQWTSNKAPGKCATGC